MPKIVIGEITIDFPNTGRDPAWSPSIIQFAEAVAEQLVLISGGIIVAPTVTTLSDNGNIALPLTPAIFASGTVQSFNFDYSIFIKTTTTVSFQNSTDTFTLNNHTLSNGTIVKFSSLTAGSGISTGTDYFIVNSTTNTFQLSSSFNGAVLPITSDGTGVFPFVLTETGNVLGVYDSDKWQLNHTHNGPRQNTGQSYVTFTMPNDTICVTTVALPETYDTVNSRISYSAKTLLTSN